jgi:hypothetical protein
MDEFTLTITDQERVDIHIAIRYMRDQSLGRYPKMQARMDPLLRKFELQTSTTNPRSQLARS